MKKINALSLLAVALLVFDIVKRKICSTSDYSKQQYKQN